MVSDEGHTAREIPPHVSADHEVDVAVAVVFQPPRVGAYSVDGSAGRLDQRISTDPPVMAELNNIALRHHAQSRPYRLSLAAQRT